MADETAKVTPETAEAAVSAVDPAMADAVAAAVGEGQADEAAADADAPTEEAKPQPSKLVGPQARRGGGGLF